MTRTLRRPLTVLVCLMTAWACSGDVGSGPRDAGVASRDAGPARDGATATDAPSGMDSPMAVDGGSRRDAGMPSCDALTFPPLAVEDIAGGTRFERPILVVQPHGVTDTLYVAETVGRIRLVRGGAVLPTPFLDINARTGSQTGSDERGLLGVAFHPDYSTTGRFFVMYTPVAGGDANREIIAEYRRSADPDVAEPTEVRRLVVLEPTAANHNGGMLEFGYDGYLYASTGDGGGTGGVASQNLLSLNGKILRLDVDGETAGFAAPGNPYSAPDGLPQIWSYGLRNPWRFAIDRLTGDIYIADVGQNTVEEVDVQAASSTGGENYGWVAYEGLDVYSAGDLGSVPMHAEPVVTYRHGSADDIIRGGCSVTGGRVYRGTEIPQLDGLYFFGDWCSDDVAALRWCGGTDMISERVPALSGLASQLVGWGEDRNGEIYMTFLDGRVVKIVPG